MLPDAVSPAASLQHALSRVARRLYVAQALYAAAAALTLAAVLHLADAGSVAVWLAGLVCGGVLAATARRRGRRYAAALLERASPSSRNTIVTAEELLTHPGRCSARMQALVVAHAARLSGAIAASAVAPLVLPACTLAAVVVILLLAPSSRSRGGVSVAEAVRRLAGGTGPGVVRLSVVIDPPAYARQPAVEAVDPERIEALAGSTVRLAIDGDPRRWRLRFNRRDIAWSNGAAAVPLSDSGYFAVEPVTGSDGHARLIPVTVVPDRPPAVRIEAPARDLVLPDATRTIAVRTTASDDLALEALELRYTKVSGTGEDFEFVEGTLPLSIARTSRQNWSGAAGVALAALQLEPGDSLVYRAVARDGRPGAGGESSSDTFFIEVAGPGQVALEGFDLPPEQERYALSQQMVVLKIERLRAREAALSRDAVREATAAIAAEQRAVRAFFIFLMGGHVEDEEVEAEQSNEIQEGRLENTARREISAAVHLMTRAEQGLVAASTGAALPPAKQAVEALQRAFGRNRYILRTPPSRAEIDPARRLSGNLSAAESWRRNAERPAPDAVRARLDALVSAAGAVSRRLSEGQSADRAWFAALAEQALAIDPGSRQWQQVAGRLSAIAGQVSSGRSTTAELLAKLNEAMAPAMSAARAATSLPGPTRGSPLRRAWAEGDRR